MSKQLINHLFEFRDLSLTTMSHTFAESSIWLEEGMHNRVATYDLVIREMPDNRNFLVFAGLDEIVNYLQNLRFTPEDIKYLLAGGLITPRLAKYLKNFRFTGDVYAMPEGSVFFSGEPIVRITAPMIEAALIEIVFFGIAVSNILFMSKAARLKLASPDIAVSVGMQRAQSFESGMKAIRCGYIANLGIDVWVNFVKKYKLLSKTDYIINAQHLFIKSFSDELTAFKKIAEYFPDNAAFMIDTYDFRKGLANAVKVGKELKSRGFTLRFVTIDGGDLEKLSKYTRKVLDKNGLKDVSIIIASNLDEYKIKRLVKSKTPVDLFVSATEYVTCSDSPKLEVVYKMAELREGRTIQHTAKLTPGKQSYPGRKQVFRKFRNNKMIQDVIGLENEKLGKPLLKHIMKGGRVVGKMPDLEEIRKYFDQQLKILPKRLLEIDQQYDYPVKISNELKKLFNQVKRQHG